MSYIIWYSILDNFLLQKDVKLDHYGYESNGPNNLQEIYNRSIKKTFGF